MYYQRHLFFCVNQRSSGKQCCAQQGAQAACDNAKSRLKSLGLHGRGLYRVSSAGCLGRCDEGPVLVVYPDGVFYRYTSQDDINEIIQSHILDGKIVGRLLIPQSD